jgi:hypothetical protein
VNFLQRRRAWLLIRRAQPFADEPLVAVANFTWAGNSMGAQPGMRGREEWAGGLPDWTLIHKAGPVPFSTWRAIRFEFPDREPAVLQPFGREVDDLLQAHQAAQPTGERDGVCWEALVEVTVMTTSRGPFEEDVFVVLAYDDGTNDTIPLGEAEELLQRLQELPGFDNESFIRAMGVSDESICSLWRR